MRFWRFYLSFSCCAAIFMALLLVVPSVSAAPAANNGASYEIPISELNKVEKKTPVKHVKSEPKKKKKSETPQPKSQAAAKPAATPENTQILHSPYSFVVADKRTVISAVINSKSDIQEVNCTLPASEGGKGTEIKMEKVEGTRFTYTATLPGVPPKTSSLRYTISFVDTQGKDTRSREFVTPVSASPLIPSWQLENSDAAGGEAAGKAGETGKEGEASKEGEK